VVTSMVGVHRCDGGFGGPLHWLVCASKRMIFCDKKSFEVLSVLISCL
jgi:hypothetical protein